MSEQRPSKAMLLMSLLALAGCSMSNEELIAEVKRCEAAGMKAVMGVRLWNGRIAEVQCWPKDTSHE